MSETAISDPTAPPVDVTAPTPDATTAPPVDATPAPAVAVTPDVHEPAPGTFIACTP